MSEPTKEIDDELLEELSSESDEPEPFPKKVGIVFLEDIKRKRKIKPHLNFDQEACSYFVLQMNSHQELFNFNIITWFEDEGYLLYKEGQNIEKWFLKNITKTLYIA